MPGGDRLDRPGLFDHRRLRSVELEEHGRLDGVVESRVAIDGLDLYVVEQLHPSQRDPRDQAVDDRLDGLLDRVEAADGRGDRFGDGCQSERDFGDHPEGSLGADQKCRQVVAGDRLSGSPRGADDRSVGHHGFDRQHAVTHRAVADGVGARSRCRGHPAETGIGAGIDREEDIGFRVGQVPVELFAGDSGLDGGVHVAGVDRDDSVHAAGVHAQSASDRHHPTFDGRAGSEGDQGHSMAAAGVDGHHHLVGRQWPADGLGRARFVVRDIGGVLVAIGLGGRDPFTEVVGQCSKDVVDVGHFGHGSVRFPEIARTS